MEDALPVRQAVVQRLKASATVIAAVPAASIYGERVPDERTFPFIRVGTAFLTPNRMACHNGEIDQFDVTTFVKGPDSGPVSLAGKAVKQELEGAIIPVDGDTRELVWMNGQILPDRQEPDAWLAVNTFQAV